jgi:predicted esterase
MENPQTDLHLTAEIKLYYDLFVPESQTEPAPLLIAVHGYGAHKRYMMREAKLIAPPNFAIASIQAPHQHFRETEKGYKIGFGWLTDHRPEESVALHHKFLLDLVDSLVSRGIADPKRIHLFGFSQACALNFRFAFTHPEVASSILGVCGGIPGDLETNPVYQPTSAPVFYLHSDNDEFYSQEKFASYVQKLEAFLPDVVSKGYSAKHEITDEMRRDMKKWLARYSEI